MADVGATHLLHVSPMYNKPPQRALMAHFRAIADACDLPIVIYNVPARTGIDLLPDAVEAIWGVKVTKVNTLNRIGKATRARKSNRTGKKPDSKRAIVTLAAGNDIPLFEN